MITKPCHELHASHDVLVVWCECISLITNFDYKELIFLHNVVRYIRSRLYTIFLGIAAVCTPGVLLPLGCIL